MTTLLEHFKAMQARAAAFVESTQTYTALDGRVSPVGSLEKASRCNLFINDMIYMLDGPEQRDAQAEAEASLSWMLGLLSRSTR